MEILEFTAFASKRLRQRLPAWRLQLKGHFKQQRAFETQWPGGASADSSVYRQAYNGLA
jgi:hypothetical protein